MFRRTIAIAALLLGSSALPAHAHTDVCAGEAVLLTSPPLPFLSTTPPTTVSWVMFTTLGTCATGTLLTASGTMTGSRFDTTTGTGITNTGHQFAFTGVAGVMDVRGQVVGSVTFFLGAGTGSFFVYVEAVLVD